MHFYLIIFMVIAHGVSLHSDKQRKKTQPRDMTQLLINFAVTLSFLSQVEALFPPS